MNISKKELKEFVQNHIIILDGRILPDRFKHYPDQLKSLIHYTSFLNDCQDVSTKERLLYIINDIDEILLCSCGRRRKVYKNFFRETCGNTKCMANKRKQTNLERYGMEHVTQSEEFKDKRKQTNLKRYGVEHASQSEEFKDKMKQTNLKRYGVEYISQLDEIKNKVKQTNIERYGVEYISQLDEIKNKVKQTNIERYGVEHASQLEEFKDKMKQTNIERYGVEHASQLEEFKDKMKQTNLKRYGVEYSSQADEVKDKIKQTNLERYGVENASQVDEIKDKISETHKLLWKDPEYAKKISSTLTNTVSKAETRFHEQYLNEDFKPQCPIEGYVVDFLDPSTNTIVEFFGDYWHCNPEKYQEDYYHSRIKKTAKEIWEYDQAKIKTLENAGYRVIVVWESEFKSNSKSLHEKLSNIKKFL